MRDQKSDDFMLVCGKSDDGTSYDVLRRRGEGIEAGRVRPLDEGKSIHGEVVRLKPREDSPVLFDVEVHHDARPSTGRPAKVANERYRRGWESIWAKAPREHSLN
ncbi:MAG: hypothetical protein HKN10_03045 [Myxococcales bacterium]|nr:hypothetical protein [Myxococcales bacterium]